ncbi:MAG: hypothetical protein VKK42_02765 [Lyngbya sp.]|nr:hypothetical protein [Lyngbya sp.]
MKNLPEIYQKLEFLTEESTQLEVLSYQNFKKPKQHPLVEFIQNVADFSQKTASVVLDILLNNLEKLFSPNNQPTILERRDKQGNLYWSVYDPIKDLWVYFDSENELMAWLEHRYYSNFK